MGDFDAEKDARVTERMKKSWGRLANLSMKLTFQEMEAKRRGDTEQAEHLKGRRQRADSMFAQIDEILDPPPLGEPFMGASYPPKVPRER